jgi:hypothetical protein
MLFEAGQHAEAGHDLEQHNCYLEETVWNQIPDFPELQFHQDQLSNHCHQEEVKEAEVAALEEEVTRQEKEIEVSIDYW